MSEQAVTMRTGLAESRSARCEFHICSGDWQKKQEQRYKTDDEHYNEITVVIHFAPFELSCENILEHKEKFFDKIHKFVVECNNGNKCADMEHYIKEKIAFACACTENVLCDCEVATA